MKSGLMNFCYLNTVLMVVILGLVIYCCVRQSRENFNNLAFSGVPGEGECPTFGVGDIEYPCGQDNKLDEGGKGKPTSAASGALSEEEIDELISARMEQQKENNNANFDEEVQKLAMIIAEKRSRNQKIKDYLAEEEKYISEYLNNLEVDEGETKPSQDVVRGQLRGDDRNDFDEPPAYPTWDVMSNVNNSNDITSTPTPFTLYDVPVIGN